MNTVVSNPNDDVREGAQVERSFKAVAATVPAQDGMQ